MDHLIKPYGGILQNILVDEARTAQLKNDSQNFPAITLTQRQLCDLDLLMNGAFSPLRGFMTREVYESVLETMRLPEKKLWSMPITLDVPDAVAEKLEAGGFLGLNDPEGFMLAVLRIKDKWKPDKKREAQFVYGTDSLNHPGVHFLLEQVHGNYVGGDIEGIQHPMHYDFEALRYTPEELRHLERTGKKGQLFTKKNCTTTCHITRKYPPGFPFPMLLRSFARSVRLVIARASPCFLPACQASESPPWRRYCMQNSSKRAAGR